MKIQGEFFNKEGRLVSIVLSSSKSDGADIIIGSRDGSRHELCFSGDSALTTESGFQDPTDVIIGQSASIQLRSDNFAPELSGRSFRDVGVEISLDGVCVFAGYLEPNTYNQPYVDVFDDLELNCIDVLSALQYRPFRGVTGKDSYRNAVAEAHSSTFWELLCEALLSGDGGDSDTEYTILYDGSRRTVTGTSETVFNDLSISDLVFLGEDEDDVQTYQDVVEAVLKYLNLHIVQDGKVFFIFSWESVRKGNVPWITLRGDGSSATSAVGSESSPIALTDDIAGDTDGEITLTEAFNRLCLKVSPKSIDELIESPLDSMDSAYPHRALYCTEIRAHDYGEFRQMIAKGADLQTLWNSGKIKDGYWNDWYILVKRNPNWIIGRAGKDIVDTYKDDDTRQENIANQLAFYPGAALISIGCVKYNDTDDNKKDNSPKSSLDMSDYLVISAYEADDGSTTRDNLVTPLAEYVGSSGGAVYSPPDGNTINYLVISGTFRLEQKISQSITVRDFEDAPLGMYREGIASGMTEGTPMTSQIGARFDIEYKRIKSHGHADCYLINKWYKNGNGKSSFGTSEDLNPTGVTSHPAIWPSGIAGFYSNGLRMPSEFDEPDFEYQYSSVGNSDDHLSKVPVLECMLVIGNQDNGTAKVLVEDMSKDGAIGALSWKTFKSWGECKASHPNDTAAAEDEFYAQTFFHRL